MDAKRYTQKAYEILATDVLPDGVTSGKFSTLRRYREFYNEKYHCPYFETGNIGETAV